VYLIWREAAFDVGQVLSQRHANPHDQRDAEQAARQLRNFKDAAARLRDSLKRAKDPATALCAAKPLQEWAWDQVSYAYERAVAGGFSPGQYRGAYRVAFLYRLCEFILEMMSNEPVLDQVGQTMAHYLEQGLLLADVHSGNIGKVRRDRWTPIVITDPGHAVDLRGLGRC
jgi:hypothetical protein